MAPINGNRYTIDNTELAITFEAFQDIGNIKTS